MISFSSGICGQPGRLSGFYDPAQSSRMKPFVDAFLSFSSAWSAKEAHRINFWSRAPDWPPDQGQWSTDLDVTDVRPMLCRAADPGLWNGRNLRPVKPQFSMWHRDVVPSYSETEDAATASFALPDRPCDDDDPQALNRN